MTQEPQNQTFIVGHGKLLSKITRIAMEGLKTRKNVVLVVGTAVRKFLDRMTEARGSFNRIPYIEDPKADPDFIQLRLKGEKDGNR